MKKNKIIKNIVIIMIIILTIGCSNEKIYKNNGIAITMTKGLFYKKHETATIYYENDKIFIIGLEEKYENLIELDINEETTIEEYAEVIFLNQEQSYDLIKDDNLYYYTYEYEANNSTFFYVSTIHKGNNGFWICNFACNEKDKEQYFELFLKWAKSIKFY